MPITRTLILEMPAWKTPGMHRNFVRAIRGYCVEAMTHDGALLLAALQTGRRLLSAI